MGQSADGLGWIGSHRMDPWTTLELSAGCGQGYLYRRAGYGVTATNERAWYVLTPTRLCVYSARDEKDKKSELVISKACQVVVSPRETLAFFLADRRSAYRVRCARACQKLNSPETNTCSRLPIVNMLRVEYQDSRVCVQPRPSAVNVTLPAFTAERRRLLISERSAANPPHTAAAVD